MASRLLAKRCECRPTESLSSWRITCSWMNITVTWKDPNLNCLAPSLWSPPLTEAITFQWSNWAPLTTTITATGIQSASVCLFFQINLINLWRNDYNFSGGQGETLKHEPVGSVLIDRQKLIPTNVSRPFYEELVEVLNFLRSGTSDFLRYLEQVNISSSFLEGNFILKLTLISIQSANIFHSCRWRVHGVYPDGRLVRSVVSDRLGIQSVRRGIFRQGDNVKSFRSRASQAKRNQRWRFIDDSRRQDAHFHFLFHG